MAGSQVKLVVNGVARTVSRDPERSLLVVLREELGLTGAKYSCGEGECGACTVLVDGRARRSCVVPVADAVGSTITTIEGLRSGEALHPIQQAFLEAGGLQCGYCTPGMVLAVRAALDSEGADATAIREAIETNVCRCGTYPRILQAVERLVASGPDGGRDVGEDRTESRGGGELPRPRRPWDLVEAGDREYFERFGPGLVVVLPVASMSHGRGQELWSTDGGGWLHLGETGAITAFTGKVDVGQDNRTALSLLVAEELCAPLGTVRLVMGDTDLCPHDIGTFGSRSMADAGEVLRATAASARATLLDLASRQWEVAVRDLEAADGAVRSRDGARTIGYGDLVRGLNHLEKASLRAATTPAASWRLAGRPIARLDATGLVTGETVFGSDLVRPGMLHGRVLRPPAAGAELVAVDTAHAEQMPGVVVVRDGTFIGVAALDPVTAGQAIEAIQTRWRTSPSVAEGELDSHLRSHPVEVEGWEGAFEHEEGNVDPAFKRAAMRFEATYTTAYIAHVPLETRVAIAEWDGERVTVWVGTQRPFGVREDVAGALELDEAQVRVIVPPTGSGFGGKHGGDVAIEAALLARGAGRPVKVRWSRSEEFSLGYLRPAAVIDARSAIDAKGRITAWQFTNWNSGAPGIRTPYDIDNQRIEFRPAESPLAQGSYRGLAATANHFARESQMDEMARAAGVDPLEFRLRHLDDERLAGVFRAAAERADWGSPLSPGRGRGIAGGIEKGGHVATCAEVSVDSGGRLTVERIVTALDCGAIVNPDNLTNQVEGATIMGLGGALFEEIHFANGAITNGSMTDYRVPRFSDVPSIEVVLIDRKDQPSAGAGESPLIAVAPAIANAIFAATGRRLRALPLAPDGRVEGDAPVRTTR